MNIIRNILALVAILIPLSVSAQFYVTGDDPGKARWYSVETDNFKIIYPEGTDSLARVYARKIEGLRIPVSLTAGYASGDGNGNKLPVVMHAYNAANGSVAWAPERMDLFTIPSAYNPEPLPWSTMLSVHESRHISQMQFGMTKALKPFNFVFGEMWNILVSLIYPGIALMEGDAVVTETAWTPSGRGRTADFLNYYWVAFDNGDFRTWDQWRFPSQVNFVPNYYSLGYLTIGGFRYLYDCPEFMSDLYNLSARRPYNLASLYTTTRKSTGKRFNDAFMEVCDTMYTLWNADAEARKPYIPAEQVTKESRTYTDYESTFIIDSDIYSIKKGHIDVPSLVHIDEEGNEHFIRRLAYNIGGLQWSENLDRIYWSETSTDKRWNLKTKSQIRYIEKGSKRIHTFKKPELLYNPIPSPSEEWLSAVRYEIDGRSYLDLIEVTNGKTIQSFQAPDSLQLVETVWIGDCIYATAISDNGYGIYSISPYESSEKVERWKMLLSPEPVKIKDFSSYGNNLTFTCDRTGVNEIYHLDITDGILYQKTSTRYGSSDFQYSKDGKWLYYSSQTINGKKIFRTCVDSLMNKQVDFAQLHHYPIAEAITTQEKAIARHKDIDTEVNISEPEKYRKFPHIFNVHSWAPVYVNVDNIMNMSFDYIWQAASLGATGIFQNQLSTARGEFGYSAHKDPYNPAKWRHSGHARITYSGLYPVIEASLNFNDRAARQFNSYAYLFSEGKTSMEVSSRELQTPYIEGRISTYIPFNFSSGGWYRGVIPRLSYRIGNDRFNTGLVIMEMQEQGYLDGSGEYLSSYNPVFIRQAKGKNTFRHSITGSVRGYTVLSTANSSVYPRWGIGAETGVSASIESRKYLSPMGYVYIYGYTPGIIGEQGFKFTLMHQHKLRSDSVFGQQIVDILPRGLSSNASLSSWLSIRNAQLTKLTADYAIPIFIGDLSIGGSLFAIKRLVISPHFDYTFIGNKGLWSAGGDMVLDMNSILTVGWPFSFGVSMSFNGGSYKNEVYENGINMNRFFIGPTFNVSF